MSLVHCLVVRGGRIVLIEAHWREVKHWLESDFPDIDVLCGAPASDTIDAGYIVIDYDQHVVVNCQTAFALPDDCCISTA